MPVTADQVVGHCLHCY